MTVRAFGIAGFVVLGLILREPGADEPTSESLVLAIVDELSSGTGDAETTRSAWDRLERFVESHLTRLGEDSTASRDRRRAVVIGLRHLAVARTPAWRDAWCDRIVMGCEWALAEDDLLTEAALLAFYAATSLNAGGRPESAARVLDTVLEDPRIETETYQTRLYERRAVAARLLGDTASALEFLDSAHRNIARGESALVFSLLAEEFRILVSLGLTDRAARVLEHQERLVEKDPTPYEAGSLIWNRVQLAHARTRHSQVIAYAEENLRRLPRDGRNRLLRARLAFYRGLSLAERGLSGDSELDVAAAALDALLGSGELDRLATEKRHAIQRRVVVALEMGEFAASEEYLRRSDSAADPGGPPTLTDVRQLALWSRLGRLRSSGGAASEALSGADRRFLDRFGAFLESWRRTPIDEAGVGFLHYPYRREVVAECIEAALALADQDPRDAFEWVVKTQAQGTLARVHEIPAADLDTVRRALIPPDGGLLAFVPGPFGSHLFALDGERLHHFRLDREAVLAAANAEARAEVISPPERIEGRVDPEWRSEASERLARLLFPPPVVERMKGWRSVYVTGFELLGPAPIESLPIDGFGELGLEWAVSRLPSIPLGVWLAERAEPRSSAAEEDGGGRMALGVLAATTWDEERWPGLARIPLTEEDLATLTGSLPASRVADGVGREATLAALSRQRAPELERLVILAHGVRDESLARPNCMLLADGPLSAVGLERLYAGGRAPAVVILATCEVNRAALRRGDDGVQQLSGALLSSGAQAVAASDDQLDYHATVRLVGRVVHHLVEDGVGPAEALRRARAALKSDPRFDHPFFYGNLHLIGLLDG